MEKNSSSPKAPVNSCLRDLLSFMSFWDVVMCLHEDEEWFPPQLVHCDTGLVAFHDEALPRKGREVERGLRSPHIKTDAWNLHCPAPGVPQPSLP